MSWLRVYFKVVKSFLVTYAENACYLRQAMPDLLTQPATHLLALLRSRQISAVELAELHLERIARMNPALKAVVDFDPDAVLAQALAADNGKETGELQGLPLTVKSSIAVAGRLCETGSLANRGLRPAADAEAVRRLRAAGAVVLGVTNCPENLLAYETDNLLYGRTANPWNLDYSAGGSSGGEAAAIAAGLSAGGLGSDGGGSVRTPAHANGICSLKPTPGRIPTHDHIGPPAGPFSLLGVVGPMARTIADVSLLFRIACGAFDTDPTAAPVPFREVTLAEARSTPIGYFEDDGLTPVTPETRLAVRMAIESLRVQGFRVEPYRPKFLEAARKLWYTFFVQCGAMLTAPQSPNCAQDCAPAHAPLSPIFADFLGIAAAEPPLDGPGLLAAWCAIDPLRTRALEEMRRFPILLCPACAIPAFKHGEREWIVEGKPLAYLDAMRYTQWFNLLGAPAAVVPMAHSPEGLPIGVQIAGRPWQDERVLAVAGALDADSPAGYRYRQPTGLTASQA
jgi:Asp-tRNA(Asn)/Glu-tRNA(Gln) amidotransferase A subunit family amidase